MKRAQKKKAIRGYQFLIDGVVKDRESFSEAFFKLLIEDVEFSVPEAYSKHEELVLG